jgi:ketosteroid isomerase-like protein
MRKIFIVLVLPGFLLACNNSKETAKEDATVKSATDSTGQKETPPAEFADSKYMDWGKKHQMEFQNGDIDAWVSQFADNVVYLWSAGDSLTGKEAVTKYWKERRGNVIKDIKFTDDIWLPIKVNKSQTANDIPGVWLLSWYQVHATYNTGKSLEFGVHNVMHFNDKDQVDRVVQYIDRAPINAATMKAK